MVFQDLVVHNGFIFVCCRVQSPVCHKREMAAETQESFIIKEKKKHVKIVLLGKDKLNTIKVLNSKF